ncbi:MAG: calcium-binding protein [Gallionella sp.]|nr:calcium-binding protein [Gallionella sp.]
MATVEIRVDIGNITNITGANNVIPNIIPHTFMQITGPDGTITTVGFKPLQDGSAFGPGQVANDAGHPYDASSGTIQITDEQYQKLMDYVNRSSNANPPLLYDLSGEQCASWVVNGLRDAGIVPAALAPQGIPLYDTLVWNPYSQAIGFGVANLFNLAQTYVRPPPPRRDPLALDLNGNGLETVGINTAAPILFDNNGDGVKTATGWISSNDGLLVWDRNGNGAIDNGRELFGDATMKSDGTLAADGFAALADLDANLDGAVNALDAGFTNLRVWRDLNQDGVSEAGEIFTLDSFQIAGINLANTVANTALGNGNTLNETGSYVRTDGTTGLAGNINLASNVFFSQFTDALPPTAAIQALPDMNGAGMVRGLRDAAGRSAQLEAALGLYAAATCDVQKAMLDGVLSQWSATSTFITTADRIPAATFSSGTGITSVTLEGIVTGTPAYAVFMDKLGVVERFNGQTFRPLPDDPSTIFSYTILVEQQAFIGQSYQALKGSVYDSLLVQTRLKPYLDAITLGIDANGITMDTGGINTALDTLSLTDPKGALLDLLELDRVEGQQLRSIGWAGMDTERLRAYAEQTSIDPQLQTMLCDLHVRIGSGTVTAVTGDILVMGQGGNDVLNGSAGNEILGGGAGNDMINAGGGNDTVYGGAGNDTITESSNGNDTIDGGAGDDTITDTGVGTNILRGGDGNDTVTFGYTSSNTVEGGTGDDLIKVDSTSYCNGTYANTFAGGAGADRIASGGSTDTYLFNRGDGQDTLNDYGYGYGGAAGADKVVFGAGIAAGDLGLSRAGNNFVIKVNDPNNASATDQITIENWYAASTYQIENFQFADGTSLDKTQLAQMVGTAGNDNLIGTTYADTLAGLDGNDVITGNAGNDILQGGNGNDTLNDTAGVNLLDGGADTDTLTGNTGNEFFTGGAGNDTITTGTGADIIAFNRGNGQDVLNGGVGTDNTISLGGGIQYFDLALSKSGNDLILEVGSNEQITLSNWYDTAANYKSVLNLQVVADAMAAFDPASADPMLNKTIQDFDFTAVTNAFDQARGANQTFLHWNAMNSLLNAHLSASDTAALGGDLAHQYGKNGSFSGMNLAAAQNVINAPQFGAQAQTLNPLQGLQGGVVALAA